MRHEDLAAARGLREARWKVSHERSGTAQRYEPVVPIGSLHCSISSGSLNVIVPSGSKAEAGSRTNRRSTLSDLYIGPKRGLVNLRKILNSKRTAVNASPIQGGTSSSPAPSRSLATRVLRGAQNSKVLPGTVSEACIGWQYDVHGFQAGHDTPNTTKHV